ncbi:probable membrane-associated kinase regulator 6 [Abrus precatorius]|uniref:Probable membrane-associated kinase regulator 6 n=1 Tax=Abrus precatorius TaxID=3816 RepID=A0A8B8KY58_ABRPR|nr:probable membrane-associated kinase regulator 6 [Abrus precatorius]
MLNLLLKVITISRSCCSICPQLDPDRIDELSHCGGHCFVIIRYLYICLLYISFLIHHNLPNRCKMETSLPLATESFSYSWLPNCRTRSNNLKEPLLESTYNISEGTTNTPFIEECQNFNFDISITQSPSVLALADEIFSDGLIKPLFVDPSKLESCHTTPDSTQSKPSSSYSSRVTSPRTVEIHHGFLTKWKTSTCRTLRNLSRYVNQLCQKVGSSRKSTRVDDFDKEEWEVKSWSSSQQASPKSITVKPIGALHDHENSIYEAVLHCKRSIEK